MNCTNLVNVTITSVYKLQTSAFYNTGISSVSVPSTCSFINTGVFSKCLNLTSITIDAADIADHVVSSSSALLMSAGHTAKTHEGTIGMIGQHYVRTGILANEDGALLARLSPRRWATPYSVTM